MCRLIRGQRQASPRLLLLPTSVWLVLFLPVHLALLPAVSFARRCPCGSLVWDLTLDDYARAFSPEYLHLLARSLSYASLTTPACLLPGYLFTYYITHVVQSPAPFVGDTLRLRAGGSFWVARSSSGGARLPAGPDQDFGRLRY